MTREEVRKVVFESFSQVIIDKDIEISEESNIMDDLELDSIEIFNVLCSLEETFQIKVSDALLRKMIYVKDVINVICEIKEGTL